jgi:hypothetical protein
LSQHSTPFYDEEFPEELISIFGYFEIDAIKELTTGKVKPTGKKDKKNGSQK